MRKKNEIPEADFGGVFYRWLCPSCDSVNEDEEDIRGEMVRCDDCFEQSIVKGE